MSDLHAWVNEFINACGAANLSPRTLQFYAQKLNDYEKWLVDEQRDWRVGESGRDFLAYLHARTVRWENCAHKSAQGGNLSPATLRGYVRALRRFGRWLFAEGYLEAEPFARLRLPKMPHLLPRGIVKADFDKLFAAAHTSRDRAVLLFLIESGCRAAELCTLRLTDLFVRAGYALVRGKGQQEAFVFFTDPTREALTVWLDERPALAGEFVFCLCRKLKGGGVAIEPLKPSTLHVMLKRLAKRAGVTGKCNAHSFRHAFAREMLQSGNNLAAVSDLLRHSDIQVTKMYAGYSIQELQASHARYSPLHRMLGSQGDDG